MGFRITRSGGYAYRGGGSNPRPILWREVNLQSPDILLQIGHPFRARNGDNIVPLRQHPGQRQLRRLAAFLQSNLFDPGDEFQILLEVLALETGIVAAEIVLRQILELLELPGEKSSPQWTIGNETDPQLPARRQDLVFRVAGPQAVLGLQCGDGMDRMGAANGQWSGFR